MPSNIYLLRVHACVYVCVCVCSLFIIVPSICASSAGPVATISLLLI